MAKTTSVLIPTPLEATLLGSATAIAIWVEAAGAVPGDERSLIEINNAVGTELDDIMVAVGWITDLVPLLVVSVVVVAVLLRAGRRSEAAMFSLILGLALVLNPLVKLAVRRPRPGVRPSPEALSTFSFPSGHAASTAALFAALLVIAPVQHRRRITAIGLPLVVLVGVSRLAVGVHYPSDVLTGWLWVAGATLWLARVVPVDWPARASVGNRAGHGQVDPMKQSTADDEERTDPEP